MRPYALLALVVFPTLVACGGDEPVTTAEVAAAADTALLNAEALRIGGFTLGVAAREPWRDAWQLPARVSYDPNDTQPLGSLVEGRVLEVRAYPGDRVRAGQVLVVVHSHEVMDARQRLVAAQSGAVSADSNLAVAEQAVGRAERLLAAKAIAQAEVERTQAAFTSARGTRDVAHAELERAKGYVTHLLGDGPTGNADEHAALVRAPFDGVVTDRTVMPGMVVLVGQSLVTVARGAGLGIVLRLPEEAIAGVAVGEPVRFRVPAYPGRSFDARITRIAPVVDSTSRAVELWARAAAASEGLLRAEMTADAELLGADGEPTLSVPAEAVQLMGGDTVVVKGTRLGEGMLLEAQRVRVGRRTSARAEILAGLVVGDSVVTRGAALAKAEILKRQGAGEGGHD